jgi:ubiquitin carboxyl-terminal hydrolase 8
MSDKHIIMNDGSDDASNIELNKKKINIVEMRKLFITGGLCGLVNIGNTCYMNATLQCLAATEEFVEYFRGSGDGVEEYKNDLKQGIARVLHEENKKRKRKSDDDNKDSKDSKDITHIIREKFRESLTYKLRNLLVVIWGINCKIIPKNFKKELGRLRDIFAGCDQNDSQECLSFILDQIHEETKTDVMIELKNIPSGVLEYNSVKQYYTKLIMTENITNEEKIKIKEDYNEYKSNHNREDAISKFLKFWQKYLKKNHSVIIDLFTGLYFTEIQCSKCNLINVGFEPYNIISLCIPEKNDSLENCLKNNFNIAEKLTEDNMYNCDKCYEKCVATKKTTIWHSPAKLIISLKRFINNSSKIYKNNNIIDFPLENLDLSDIISSYADTSNIYDLYGVINHSGSLRGGHYVAYTQNLINNEWYLFDDQHVLHIPYDKVVSTLVTSNAYVLFYKKRGIASIISYSDDEL